MSDYVMYYSMTTYIPNAQKAENEKGANNEDIKTNKGN
jgi:hypothetical protein